MKKQKQISTLVGFIIIAAEIIIFFGGVFAYQYFATRVQHGSKFFGSSQKTIQTQIETTNTQTAGWKTYADNFGWSISLQYPPNWELDAGVGGGGEASHIDIQSPLVSENNVSCGYALFSLIPFENHSGVTIKEDLVNSLKNAIDLEIIGQQNIKIDNQPAYEVTITDKSDPKHIDRKIIYFKYKDYEYDVELFPIAETFKCSLTKDSLLSTLETILSTIKFTK